MNKPLRTMSKAKAAPKDRLPPEGMRVRKILDAGLLTAVSESGDLESALKLGRDYVENVFAACYSEELAKVRMDLQVSEPLLKQAIDRLKAAIAELNAQPAIIHAAKDNGGAHGPAETGIEVPFSRWTKRDLIGFLLSGASSVAIGVATFMSVEATMQAAELEIFDLAPNLPSALAVMPVALAVLLKQTATLFTSEANRTRYRQIITAVGIAAFAAWVPLFSILYDGVSGVFDPYAEPNHLLGTLFNIVHLVCEPLIGAALFIQADAIMAKYSPSHKVPNPETQPWYAEVTEAADEAAAYGVPVAQAKGRSDTLMGIKGLAHIYVEAAIRQKFNEQPRNTLI